MLRDRLFLCSKPSHPPEIAYRVRFVFIYSEVYNIICFLFIIQDGRFLEFYSEIEQNKASVMTTKYTCHDN